VLLVPYKNIAKREDRKYREREREIIIIEEENKRKGN
jgi:hypothetical protein